MEEFPELIFKPYLVRSALVCGAQQLPSQISTWDIQAGAGLLNYPSSRSALNNYFDYAIIGSAPSGQINGIFAKTNVLLPAGSTINVWTSWDTVSYFYGDELLSSDGKYIVENPQVNKNKLSLANTKEEFAYTDEKPFMTEDSHGNIIGLNYTNKSGDCYVQIQVSTSSPREQGSIEYGAICYNITNNSVSSSPSESKVVSKHDYGFEQQYFFEEKIKNVTVDNFTFITSRLRTGYISKEYVVMSPRRAEAGIAYLQYAFPNPVYRANVNLTLWSDSELLRPSDCTAVVQYKNINGNWITILDLLNDIYLANDREYPTTFMLNFDMPILEFRFYSTAPQIGVSNNTGRLCIGDIKIFYMIPI